MTHFMKLNKDPFYMIDGGLKTVEIRLYDRKRQKINAGDSIVFTEVGTENSIEAEVLKVVRFDCFKDLYKAYDYRVLGYKEGEAAKYSDMYAYYTKEDEALYGVVAIEIKKLY